MNKFRIGSFYSIASPYEKIVRDYLMDSCSKLNLQPLVVETQNFHNWYRNVAEKPKVILSLLNYIENDECLVFVDADAKIIQYPQLFHEIPEEYDIAVHYLNWNEWYGYKQPKPVMELLTGTMFLRNNDKIKELCKEWDKKAIETKEWEQKVLQKVIKNYDLKKYLLPCSYCYMASTPSGKPIVKIEEPFIIHYQLGRTLKREFL